jgi:hypothetical protein
LGFHAPFPTLPDKAFSRTEVMTAFLSAFTVYSEFMKRSSQMGVPLKVVPSLLQPTPDKLFEIDTVERALSLNISVSEDRNPDFDVIHKPKHFKSYSLSYFRNTCGNFYKLKAGVDVSVQKLKDSLKESSLAPFHVTEITDMHFFTDKDFDELYSIPIDGPYEGGWFMCMFFVTNDKQHGLDVSCIGIMQFIDYSTMDEYVDKQGGQGILDQGASESACSSEEDYAALPGETRIPDIPAALIRLANEPAIYPR